MMELLRKLLEGLNDDEDMFNDFDGPDLEDMGHPSFDNVIEYIDGAMNDIKFTEYLENEYAEHYFMNEQDLQSVIDGLQWLETAPNINSEIIAKVKKQLKSLVNNGIIVERSVLENR